MRNDRLLAPTKWVATAVIPVLVAAFVILYFFPERTTQLWSWMICPSMSALIMGAGYLAGAYFFTRVSRAREWHRVGVGFVATTVFSTILLATTVLHWDRFNYDHVSFWAWLLLYGSTPALLPILWVKNQRTDPGTPSAVDAVIPRPLQIAVGVGGALQLAFAAVMFFWPDVAAEAWAWPLEPATSRSVSAFVAFPAVTWFCFLFDNRWSSFRITQQTATLGLALIGIAAVRAQEDFRTDTWFALYMAGLVVALVLNIALHVAMDRRAKRAAGGTSDITSPVRLEKGEGDMRSRRGLVMGGALLVSGLILALSGGPASAAPDSVNGHFSLQFSTGPECQTAAFCLTGEVKGKIKGQFLFIPSSTDSTAHNIVITTGHAMVTAADGSTLTCSQAGAFHFREGSDGPFTSLCIINGGSERWAGAQGYLRIAGTFTIENGGEGSYDGKVILP